VESNGPGIGVIKMAGQPRYFHVDPRGCQEAESHTRMDVFTEARVKSERKEMAVME